LPYFVTSKLFKVIFTSFFTKTFLRNSFLRGEPYFFIKNKYSFVRWRTCYGVTVLGTRTILLFLAQCMYVGVIWLLFHVLQLLPIVFTRQNSCCVSKPTMKRMQKPYWKLDLPCFHYGYWKSKFVDFLVGYIGTPNNVDY
jgi:hypothetical protein